VICPACNGEKQSMGFVDGYDARTGKSWGEYRAIGCFTCHGTGEVDDGYPVRRAWGEMIRRARVDRSLTLRDLGERVRIDFTRLSRIEHGTEVATETERQRIEAALLAANP
jgi:hypothetical protein